MNLIEFFLNKTKFKKHSKIQKISYFFWMEISDKILFVSAQPDIPYFHWQIKIYVQNFISLGINPNQIHVILGIVNKNTEPSEESLNLKNIGINVHYYKDEREQKHYIPSIKPYLIYNWLKEYPEFGKCFFLHDSDIIFRKLPNFEKLLFDDLIYLSDTIGYIGYNYIIDCCRRYESKHPNSNQNQLLQEMCDIIGITEECVECNQENSGGGQYLIKNTDYLIWDKIYRDSTLLYDKMLDYQKRFPINPGQIQFWTAEMWSLLWNLWYFDKETKITEELNFCWATDDIEKFNETPILHMAGVTEEFKKTKFYKGDFININPIDKLIEDINYFDYVDEKSSTKKYIEWMMIVAKKQLER